MVGVPLGSNTKDNGSKYPPMFLSTHLLMHRLWNSVIVQGRGDYDDRMTKFKIQYTLDGKEWQDYGKVFGDPPPGNGKIRHNLKPFYAITIRLVTLEWCGKSSCFRFGATFINE